MPNSDHANFARRGIPALRLVAGFDEPDSRLRYLLTPGDTLDKIAPKELAENSAVVAVAAYALSPARRDASRQSIAASLRAE